MTAAVDEPDARPGMVAVIQTFSFLRIPAIVNAGSKAS